MMVFVENLTKTVAFMMAAIVVDSMGTLSMTILTTIKFIVGLRGALTNNMRKRWMRHLIAGPGCHLIAGPGCHLIADRCWRRHLTAVMSTS